MAGASTPDSLPEGVAASSPDSNTPSGAESPAADVGSPTAGASPGSDAVEQRIAVGRINAPWGLRGHVKVTPLTSNPERLQPEATLLVGGEPRRILEIVSPSGYPCIRFDGCSDRDAAERLRGALIEIEEGELPDLGEGAYYVHDLVGLEVVTTSGERLGELVEVLRTGANDVYIVRRPGLRDVLLPAIADVVVEVDLLVRRMRIDPLPGLIDEAPSS